MKFSSLQSHRKSLTGSESENQSQPVKYCCIYLPDGTASLAPVRSGLSIQEMLAGICQRRGLHLPDVKIYLVGNEKKPLALNQDSLVLMDQEVKLETRVSFELEITPINKTVRILAKSTKHLKEALQPILEKYGLDVTRVLLRRPGEPDAVNLEEKVSTVAAQKLVLESDEDVKPVDVSHVVTGPSCEQSEDDSSIGAESEAESLPEMTCSFTKPSKGNHNRRTYDLEGLVELLNRVQNCRVDDQRGLLSKEALVLPEFLQLREQDDVSCKVPSSSSPPQEKKGIPEALCSEAASVPPCQSKVQSEPQEVREQSWMGGVGLGRSDSSAATFLRSMPSRGEEATAGASIPIGCPWPQAPAPHRLNESGEERSPEQAASPDRRRAQPQPESSVWSKKFVTAPHQGGLMELKSKEQPSSPQKQGVKARSKSTEEIQPAKKAFHTPQKSLPNQMDEVESKGSCPVSAPNITQQQQT